MVSEVELNYCVTVHFCELYTSTVSSEDTHSLSSVMKIVPIGFGQYFPNTLYIDLFSQTNSQTFHNKLLC